MASFFCLAIGVAPLCSVSSLVTYLSHMHTDHSSSRTHCTFCSFGPRECRWQPDSSPVLRPTVSPGLQPWHLSPLFSLRSSQLTPTRPPSDVSMRGSLKCVYVLSRESLLNYSCSNSCNFKGRVLMPPGNLSCHHSSDRTGVS